MGRRSVAVWSGSNRRSCGYLSATKSVNLFKNLAATDFVATKSPTSRRLLCNLAFGDSAIGGNCWSWRGRKAVAAYMWLSFSKLNIQSLKCRRSLAQPTKYIGCMFGCFEDLRRSSDLSAISWLGSRRKPISEILVARPGIERRTPCPASQELNHYTTAAQRLSLDIHVYHNINGFRTVFDLRLKLKLLLNILWHNVKWNYCIHCVRKEKLKEEFNNYGFSCTVPDSNLMIHQLNLVGANEHCSDTKPTIPA